MEVEEPVELELVELELDVLEVVPFALKVMFVMVIPPPCRYIPYFFRFSIKFAEIFKFSKLPINLL